MKSSLLLASIATVAAIAGASLAHADDSHKDKDRQHAERSHRDGRTDRVMQSVPTAAMAGEPGHRWQYFSEPATARAVVVSPQGEYFLSRGKGLRLVAVTQPGA